MYYLYILECADKTLYTGVAVDVDRRVREHNSSKLGAKYTRARRPVKLVYTKKFRNRSLASKAECKIKKMSRAEKLKLIKMTPPLPAGRQGVRGESDLALTLPQSLSW